MFERSQWESFGDGGEFIAQGMDDATLKKAAMMMFEQVFNEDAANLRNK